MKCNYTYSCFTLPALPYSPNTSPSQLYDFFFNLHIIESSQICIGVWIHPLEHGKLIRAHTLTKRIILFLPAAIMC